MSSLDIRPHSARVSVWAVAGLMLLGAGAFGSGVVRQLAVAGPSPFPPPQQPSLQVATATPAPAPPLPVAPPKRSVAPSPDADDAAPAVDALQNASGAAAAADASATAPDKASDRAASPATPPSPELQIPQPTAPSDTDPPT